MMPTLAVVWGSKTTAIPSVTPLDSMAWTTSPVMSKARLPSVLSLYVATMVNTSVRLRREQRDGAASRGHAIDGVDPAAAAAATWLFVAQSHQLAGKQREGGDMQQRLPPLGHTGLMREVLTDQRLVGQGDHWKAAPGEQRWP